MPLRAPLAAGPAVPLGVVPGPGSPTGIALDWIHQLLYWTEPSSGRVAVSDPLGTRHRTLHRDPQTRPWGVVVDPLNGYGGDTGMWGGQRVTGRGDRGLWGHGGDTGGLGEVAMTWDGQEAVGGHGWTGDTVGTGDTGVP